MLSVDLHAADRVGIHASSVYPLGVSDRPAARSPERTWTRAVRLVLTSWRRCMLGSRWQEEPTPRVDSGSDDPARRPRSHHRGPAGDVPHHAHGAALRRSRVPSEPQGAPRSSFPPGHEACQVGTAWVMRKGVDVWVPYYRDMAVVPGRRDDPVRRVPGGVRQGRRSLLAAAGRCRRTGDSRRLGHHQRLLPHRHPDPPRGRDRLRDQVPAARTPWSACWFGDGATSEGDWHEGLNFAGIHQLPVVLVCENNRYAISVPLSKQMAVEDVADRAPGVRVRRRGRSTGTTSWRATRPSQRARRAGPGAAAAHADRVQDLPVPPPHLRRRRPDLPHAARRSRRPSQQRPARSCSGSTCRSRASSTTTRPERASAPEVKAEVDAGRSTAGLGRRPTRDARPVRRVAARPLRRRGLGAAAMTEKNVVQTDPRHAAGRDAGRRPRHRAGRGRRRPGRRVPRHRRASWTSSARTG